MVLDRCSKELQEFQYISCCSLSSVPALKTANHYNFNTSHVVVYLLEVEELYGISANFNTSHVVVYRSDG